MIIALLGLVLWSIGWLMIRTHPEVRFMISGNPLHVRIRATVMLFFLWPLLAFALVSGAAI